MLWSRNSVVRCSHCRALNGAGAVFCARCGAALPTHGSPRSSHRVTAAGAALGLLLLAMLAAAVFLLYSIFAQNLQAEENVDPFAGKSGTTATIIGQTSASGGAISEELATSSTIPAVLVRPTAVVASSTLKATATASYRATNLVDDDLTTAWNEGVEGPGIGEWVKFQFSRQVVLSRIEIANGYQKDEERFVGSGRVKSLAIEYSTGSTQLVTLLDSRDMQTVIPTRQPVEWFKMVIVDVYPGETWDDTSLSEVRVYARAD